MADKKKSEDYSIQSAVDIMSALLLTADLKVEGHNVSKGDGKITVHEFDAAISKLGGSAENAFSNTVRGILQNENSQQLAITEVVQRYRTMLTSADLDRDGMLNANELSNAENTLRNNAVLPKDVPPAKTEQNNERGVR